MRKFSLLSGLCFFFPFVNAFAAPIHSYEELALAVRTGEHLVILLDFQKCTGNPNMPCGYFTPNKMLLMPKTAATSERIVTSDMHFTDYTGSPAYEYTKYTFNSDGSVVIRTVMYDAQSFKLTGPAHTINCTLGEGIEIHSQ